MFWLKKNILNVMLYNNNNKLRGMFLITQWNAHNPSDTRHKQLIHAGF